MEMFLIILPIIALGEGEWYSSFTALCDIGISSIFGTGLDGNEQLYSCELERALWKTTEITDRSECESWSECFLDENVSEGEICMGTSCIWLSDTSSCFCEKIVDPFSLTNGCDDCKFETPSPTYWGQCDCITDNAAAFGLEDSSHVCQCDTDILDGDNCEGSFGSGVFDSGSLPFVKEACLWDPFASSWRKISCFDEDSITIEWYSNTECSGADVSWKVQKDTCYYSSGMIVSADPTPFPTNHPIVSQAPTPSPVDTDPPTLSPLVINNSELCDTDNLVETLEDEFYEANDQQWINDCEVLLQTETQQLNIVCGCIGKFPKWMANKHLNCVLQFPYHGLTIWNMCQSSIYTQSCGSTCTGWLRRIALNDKNLNHRRRAVADETFKLTWSLDVCEEYSTKTSEPSQSPTKIPSRDPTLSPTIAPDCSDQAGTTPTNFDCTCGTAICTPGEHCIEANNMCYNNAVCHHIDASMIEAFSCTCGTSGAECNANDLGAFLCDEESEQPCTGLSTCLSGTGFELTTEWCICEHITSSEVSYCGEAQYCDVTNGWCSQYPTCSDDSGTIAATQQCSCGSSTKVCESGEYCTLSNSFSECSTYSPTYNPTSNPTYMPTNNPTYTPSWDPTNSPTVNPTPTAPACIPYKSWNENDAIEDCPQGTWGVTDRGYGSMQACEETYQTKLEESAANGLFESCSAFCIYDFSSLLSGTRYGFIWRKNLGCWKGVTQWTCFSGTPLEFFENLVDYVPTVCPAETHAPPESQTPTPTMLPPVDPTTTPTLNPTRSPSADPTTEPTNNPTSTPTHDPSLDPTNNPTANPTTPAPTCIPYKSWSETIAIEICPEGTWGQTDRGYESLQACDQSYQTELEESAANQLFESCSSWCIYDFNNLLDGTRYAFIWKNKGCWLAVTQWTCFINDGLKAFQELVTYVPTVCPTETHSTTEIPTPTPAIDPTIAATDDPTVTSDSSSNALEIFVVVVAIISVIAMGILGLSA